MKKLIGVIVILVALLSICACNNKKTTTYIGKMQKY